MFCNRTDALQPFFWVCRSVYRGTAKTRAHQTGGGAEEIIRHAMGLPVFYTVGNQQSSPCYFSDSRRCEQLVNAHRATEAKSLIGLIDGQFLSLSSSTGHKPGAGICHLSGPGFPITSTLSVLR